MSLTLQERMRMVMNSIRGLYRKLGDVTGLDDAMYYAELISVNMEIANNLRRRINGQGMPGVQAPDTAG